MSKNSQNCNNNNLGQLLQDPNVLQFIQQMVSNDQSKKTEQHTSPEPVIQQSINSPISSQNQSNFQNIINLLSQQNFNGNSNNTNNNNHGQNSIQINNHDPKSNQNTKRGPKFKSRKSSYAIHPDQTKPPMSRSCTDCAICGTHSAQTTTVENLVPKEPIYSITSSTTGLTRKLEMNMTCRSSGIFVVTCKHCTAQYMGCSGQPFNYRLRVHCVYWHKRFTTDYNRKCALLNHILHAHPEIYHNEKTRLDDCYFVTFLEDPPKETMRDRILEWRDWLKPSIGQGNKVAGRKMVGGKAEADAGFTKKERTEPKFKKEMNQNTSLPWLDMNQLGSTPLNHNPNLYSTDHQIKITNCQKTTPNQSQNNQNQHQNLKRKSETTTEQQHNSLIKKLFGEFNQQQQSTTQNQSPTIMPAQVQQTSQSDLLTTINTLRNMADQLTEFMKMKERENNNNSRANPPIGGLKIESDEEFSNEDKNIVQQESPQTPYLNPNSPIDQGIANNSANNQQQQQQPSSSRMSLDSPKSPIKNTTNTALEIVSALQNSGLVSKDVMEKLIKSMEL